MLINQKDSKISLQLSESSTNIAEATRRDGTMKSIAVLGMLYLPNTFMASVFSTVFFHVDSDASGLVAYREVWIFIAASLSATLLTVGLWVWLNERGISDLANLLHKTLARLGNSTNKKADEESDSQNA